MDITGGSTKYIHYINAGDGLMAIVIRESGTDTYYYTYTDHLGSILNVTNNAGTVIHNQNFDAWGRYRNSSNWTYSGITAPPAWLTRGYTGHEHLELFKLINMNGRMYDPVVGRMLAVDNNIQAAGLTQNYNRYSYALNNPLKYNDPDGEFVNLLFGGLLGGALNWASNGSLFNAKGLGYFTVGAIAGAVGAGVGGGISSALANGRFGAGFLGTTTVSSTGLFAGAASGGGAGITSGLLNGFGNSAIRDGSLGDIFNSGYRSGIVGGIIGGVLGGVSGGINAMGKNVNIFTGNAKLDLTQGYGAHHIPLGLDKITGKYSGQYNLDKSVAIYESRQLGEGYGSGGITLPGRGIIVGKGTFSANLDPDLLMHEYGHILQARMIGIPRFYALVGLPSLYSASNVHMLPHNHSYFWTEKWANYLSTNHVGKSFLEPALYPIENISNSKLFFLRFAGKFSILKP